MKIRSVGAKLFHAHGRTQIDMTNVIVVYHNSVNAAQN